MKVCAVICRKATLQLPDADYLSSQCHSQSSRAQNRDFCALLPARTLDFRRFEHKIGVFVRFEISMTQDVDPRDNVIAERVNGILLD